MAKDESTEDLDCLHRVLLCSIDNKCASFFADVKPKNLYANARELDAVTRLANLITKFNICVEAVVELRFQGRRNPFLWLHDATMHLSYLHD